MAGSMEQGNDLANEDEAIATINIIPFVDIALVLLIIFMLTSMAILRASIQVDLPQAANVGEKVTSTVNIVITLEGKIFLNGEEATLEEIGATVLEETKENPDLQAVISGDRGVQYGSVIEIVDILRGNGIKAFALNIERKT